MIAEKLKSDYQIGRLYNSYLIHTDDLSKATMEIKDFIFADLFKTNNKQKTHPDFIEIRKEDDKVKDISIDQIRNLKDFLLKTSINSGIKATVIVGTEYMNIKAQNASLKILEDTPKNSYIFLITTNSANILPTIYSRCAKIKHLYNVVKISNPQEKYLKLLLHDKQYFNEKLETIAEFGNKNRDLWLFFSNLISEYINKLTRNAMGVNVKLSTLEQQIKQQLQNNSPLYVEQKYRQATTIINNTIKYDLDMRASLILLIELFRK
ncbi:MAG: DNA polymerase III subunit delta' [Rickettsiaceae bacterium]|nr:DNA polymerase III subunit delta' [Rickettsiaceae bacterium]